jgi:hypothetical protein
VQRLAEGLQYRSRGPQSGLGAASIPTIGTAREFVISAPTAIDRLAATTPPFPNRPMTAVPPSGHHAYKT